MVAFTQKAFQSLLVQVSFKTGRHFNLTKQQGFNPFSFRSPSKLNPNPGCCISAFQSLLVQVSFKTGSTLLPNCEARFNPFSFRSPSKPTTRQVMAAVGVSIPSRSGLLQNRGDRWSPRPRAVSIPSRSGLLQNRNDFRIGIRGSFNPFSFRSPSKRGDRWSPRSPSFNPFSFRSPSKRRPDGGQHENCSFNPFSFRSPSKRWDGDKCVVSGGFNPFSFRSPSKRHPDGKIVLPAVSIPSRSGLLQNVDSTLAKQTIRVSIPSRSGLLQN